MRCGCSECLSAWELRLNVVIGVLPLLVLSGTILFLKIRNDRRAV